MARTPDMITLLGHTAAGKTSLAAQVAAALNGEVISADSRQVYRGMTIGTGKDYNDYVVNGKAVPYHLIDIVDAGYTYNVYEFQRDFTEAYLDITGRGRLPVLCGGTGMYIESVLKRYRMIHVPENTALREELEVKELDELVRILEGYKTPHNQTDTTSPKRVIRAIEIADYMERNGDTAPEVPEIRALNIGISYARDLRRERITKRLTQRLEEGMTEEVSVLLRNGITYEQLEYYGLEYRFIARYLKGMTTKQEMFRGLNTAIHRFAKRQMTYFRGMERRGTHIHWIDGSLPPDRKSELILELYNRFI